MSAPRTLTFFGGAATATGSMILLEAAGARVLLDAGLFEGDLHLTATKNRDLPLDPAKVDAILLSQAGLTYAGRVPQLVRHGFAGAIHATPATRDLAAVLHTETALTDLSGEQAGEPVYTLADVVAAQGLAVGQPYHRPVHLRRNLVFEFADAGHILGSATIELRTGEGGSHRIVYSGCLGRPGSPLLADPEPMTGDVDTLIIGGPFAHATHPSFAEAEEQLATVVRETVERGGQLLVPSATVGPVHEFVRALQRLWREDRIPGVPIWLDTPAAISFSTILRLHPEAVPHSEDAYRATAGGPFDQALIRYAAAEGMREELDALTAPAIIIAPSEMGDTGRAAHHLHRLLPDPNNTVLFTGFQEEGSVGQLLEVGTATLLIEGRAVEAKARVQNLPAFSGHADGEEMRAWIRQLGTVRRAFVVHGDDLAVAMMVTILREEGVRDVIVPREGESFPF